MSQMIDSGRVINTTMAFWDCNPQSQPQPNEASSPVIKGGGLMSTHAIFSPLKSLAWIYHILTTAHSVPVTSISVTFQYQLKQLIYHYFNMLSSNNFEIWNHELTNFRRIKINKSKWRFCSLNRTEISQTHPAAKPEYSLNATSRSTFLTELSQ